MCCVCVLHACVCVMCVYAVCDVHVDCDVIVVSQLFVFGVGFVLLCVVFV